MKKRISVDVEIEITGDMLLEGLKASDPLLKINVVGHVMRTMTGAELRGIIETLPMASKLFLQDLKDFVTRIGKELDDSLKPGVDG